MKRELWLLNVDCDPFYLSLTPKEASEIDAAIEPFGGNVSLDIAEAIDVTAKEVIEAVRDSAKLLTDEGGEVIVDALTTLLGKMRHFEETER